MRYLLIILSLVLFSCSFMPTASNLMLIDLGMSKKQVMDEIGKPEALALSFKTEDGDYIQVLHYRIAQYDAAIDGVTPYYDIYGFFFKNNKLEKIEKLESNTRLTEEAALRMMGVPDKTIIIK
jgi:outer membrane protein assembly factor BamE (lipoprotein component of BamABCDE complex)